MVKIKITMPSFMREDKVEKAAANVPPISTEPRTQPKIKKTENIMKKSVRKVKVSPEGLREKIESIKYSRDYSLLFPADEPVVPVSTPVEYPTEASDQPGSERKAAPLKHSTEASKVRPGSKRKFASPPKYNTRQNIEGRKSSGSYRYSRYSTESSRQNIKRSYQETATKGVKRQDYWGSRHERREEKYNKWYEGRRGRRSSMDYQSR